MEIGAHTTPPPVHRMDLIIVDTSGRHKQEAALFDEMKQVWRDFHCRNAQTSAEVQQALYIRLHVYFASTSILQAIDIAQLSRYVIGLHSTWGVIMDSDQAHTPRYQLSNHQKEYLNAKIISHVLCDSDIDGSVIPSSLRRPSFARSRV